MGQSSNNGLKHKNLQIAPQITIPPKTFRGRPPDPPIFDGRKLFPPPSKKSCMKPCSLSLSFINIFRKDSQRQ